MNAYPGQGNAGVAASAPRSFWRSALLAMAVFSGTSAAALMYDVLPPIMNDLSEHFGGGDRGRFVAQLAATLPLVGVVFAGLAAGPLIERFGIRAVLLAAMLGFAVTGTAGVAIDSAALLLATRALMGFAIGLMSTACTSLIAVSFTGAARTRMNGWLIAVGAIAGIGFILFAGALAGSWWRAPFLLHAIVAAIFIGPVLALGPTAAAPRPARGGDGDSLRRLAPMVPVYLTGFAFFVAMLTSSVNTPFVLRDVGMGGHQLIANLFALNAASVTIGSSGFGLIAARVAPVPALRVALLAIALGNLLVGLAHSLPVFAVGLILKGIAVGVGLTTLWTLAMARAPADLAPRALGLMNSVIYFGGAISPILTAPITAATGVRGIYFVLAGALTLGVAASFLFRTRPAEPGVPAARPI